MRVIFMGTPAYALGSLRALAAAEFVELAAVVTRPDAVSGRGKKLIASPVKELATQLGVPVIETKSLRGDDVRARLHDIAPDVIAVTAFGAIVPDDLIALPKLACLNVHASLLPRWRGAAPMQRALLAGDERLGYSVMRIEHGLDTGAYCRQGSVWVGERTYPELS
ncbi:MAG: methionyl-tRNA formyltransferase, partial [Coriobacteriia bacterium]|nr:methionyl-tRNA formyltransferase [Coriobacteriia bacterium]